MVNRIIYADLVKIVFKEIENLPHLARKVFKMTYIDGLKPKEIATELNMSSQNVRNNKNRAVELLRTSLDKKDIPISFLFLLAIFVQLLF